MTIIRHIPQSELKAYGASVDLDNYSLVQLQEIHADTLKACDSAVCESTLSEYQAFLARLNAYIRAAV